MSTLNSVGSKTASAKPTCAKVGSAVVSLMRARLCSGVTRAPKMTLRTALAGRSYRWIGNGFTSIVSRADSNLRTIRYSCSYDHSGLLQRNGRKRFHRSQGCEGAPQSILLDPLVRNFDRAMCDD